MNVRLISSGVKLFRMEWMWDEIKVKWVGMGFIESGVKLKWGEVM